MAKEKKLDCVILGLLSHEDLTGYEIKKRMDTALTYFWGASFGSIYPTLGELVDRGFAIRKECGENKRNKQIYSITEAGKEYLREWLKLPVEKDELRYETLLKLFFGNEEGEAQAIAHIEAFREKTEKDMAFLLEAKRRLEANTANDGTHKYYLLTVEFGLYTFRAYLEWCEEAKKFLESSLKAEQGGAYE